uniref:SGF29 C-terminal domain-containing protein n=1 Tax=Rhabditophanes sp. KR3021 TaxID=114890 RepID=A0AC35TMK8_9BILA
MSDASNSDPDQNNLTPLKKKLMENIVSFEEAKDLRQNTVTEILNKKIRQKKEPLANLNKYLKQKEKLEKQLGREIPKFEMLEECLKVGSKMDIDNYIGLTDGIHREGIKLSETILEIINQMNDKRTKAFEKLINDRHNCPISEFMNCLIRFGDTLPVYIPPIGSVADLKGVGAIQMDLDATLEINSYAAAKINEVWCLCIIKESSICENGLESTYLMIDIENPEKEKKWLNRQAIIPCPKYRADPRTYPNAVFPEGAYVLVLYPQTTSFYKGIVLHPPKTLDESYAIIFESDTNTSGFSVPQTVPQMFVLACAYQTLST